MKQCREDGMEVCVKMVACCAIVAIVVSVHMPFSHECYEQVENGQRVGDSHPSIRRTGLMLSELKFFFQYLHKKNNLFSVSRLSCL